MRADQWFAEKLTARIYSAYLAGIAIKPTDMQFVLCSKDYNTHEPLNAVKCSKNGSMQFSMKDTVQVWEM